MKGRPISIAATTIAAHRIPRIATAPKRDTSGFRCEKEGVLSRRVGSADLAAHAGRLPDAGFDGKHHWRSGVGGLFQPCTGGLQERLTVYPDR